MPFPTAAVIRTVPTGALELLAGDRSKRSAQAACLRASPFCSESKSLQDGVERLDAWLTMSCELNCVHLNQVVVSVLACFSPLVEAPHRIRCVRDLNEAWIQVTGDILGPLARKVDERHLLDGRLVALCTLCEYLPERHGEQLTKVSTTGSAKATRSLVEEVRSRLLAERARRRIVGKLVEAAVNNVLRRVREDAVVQQRRSKKLRRRLTRLSIGLDSTPASLSPPSPTPHTPRSPRSPPTPPSPQTPHSPPPPVIVPATPSQHHAQHESTRSNECVVCFDELAPKRPLLTCGHARCCSLCAYTLQECPLCRKAVSVIMEIFV